MAAQEAAAQITPEWVADLLAIGGDSPWLAVPAALPYLPVPRDEAYTMCGRYLERMERERKHRRSHLLPTDVLYAREGELPCVRETRRIMLSKHLLITKLLGDVPGRQP